MIVYLSSKAEKQLSKLPRSLHDLLLSRIEALSTNPFPPGAMKLARREGWRIRVGDYRILYGVNQKKKEITVLSVKHRRDAYRFN